MRRQDLTELHFIAPISNAVSMLRRGILSNRLAERVPHESVALAAVQDVRSEILVPGGRPLHDYANLYFNARNPMMFKRRSRHEDLAILRVSTDVLDLAGVVITDANAASDYRRFEGAPEGIAIVDDALTFAKDWRHANRIDYYRHKSAMCAEVLVPGSVHPRFIGGAYVSGPAGRTNLAEVGFDRPATENPDLFFQ